MKKIFIISLLLLLPFNVYALKTTSGEFPDIPGNPEYFILYEQSGTSYPTQVSIVNSNNIDNVYFAGNAINVVEIAHYRLKNGQWETRTASTSIINVNNVYATTVNIKSNGGLNYTISYPAGYGLPIDKSLIIYVPGVDSYSCVVVRDSNVIRAYKEAPATNATIPYRDYYYNSHYLYNDGEQTFSQYATLPSCINSKYLTSEFYYRTDLADIAIIMFAFIFILYFVWFHIVKKVVPKF